MFEAASQTAHIACAIFVGTIAVLSTVGNAAVIYSFARSIILRRANWYVINLAASDAAMAASTYWMFVLSSFYGIWRLGSFACSMYAFIQGICSIMSVVTLAIISAERLYAFHHPVQARNITIRVKTYVVMGAWVYCILVCIPPMLGWSKYGPSGVLTTCCFKFLSHDFETLSYMLYLTVFGFVLPCCIIGYSYLNLVRFLLNSQKGKASTFGKDRYLMSTLESLNKQSQILGVASGMTGRMSKQWSLQARHRASIIRTELKTAKIIAIVIFCFIMAWTPYATMVFVGQLGPPNIIKPWPAHFCSMFAKASVLYNPVIYAFKDKRFQRAFKKFVLGCYYKPYKVIRLSLRYSMNSLTGRSRGQNLESAKASTAEAPEINIKFEGQEPQENVVSFELKALPVSKELVEEDQQTEITLIPKPQD